MRANSGLMKKIRNRLAAKGINVFGTSNDYLSYAVYVALLTADEPQLKTTDLANEGIKLMEHPVSVEGFKKGVARALKHLAPEDSDSCIDIPKLCYELASEVANG